MKAEIYAIDGEFVDLLISKEKNISKFLTSQIVFNPF